MVLSTSIVPHGPYGHESPYSRNARYSAIVDPKSNTCFYIEPALLYFRCYRVWFPETITKRITDTIAWIPIIVIMPTSSPVTIIGATARDLTAEMLSIQLFLLLPPLSSSLHHSLIQLNDIFQDVTVCCQTDEITSVSNLESSKVDES